MAPCKRKYDSTSTMVPTTRIVRVVGRSESDASEAEIPDHCLSQVHTTSEATQHMTTRTMVISRYVMVRSLNAVTSQKNRNSLPNMVARNGTSVSKSASAQLRARLARQVASLPSAGSPSRSASQLSLTASNVTGSVVKGSSTWSTAAYPNDVSPYQCSNTVVQTMPIAAVPASTNQASAMAHAGVLSSTGSAEAEPRPSGPSAAPAPPGGEAWTTADPGAMTDLGATSPSSSSDEEGTRATSSPSRPAGASAPGPARGGSTKRPDSSSLSRGLPLAASGVGRGLIRSSCNTRSSSPPNHAGTGDRQRAAPATASRPASASAPLSPSMPTNDSSGAVKNPARRNASTTSTTPSGSRSTNKRATQ
mmetsp:Transcript_12806/g.49057  ORF Transcript_12806/g.49057 Transcript_12806/m.49057 type:complete len:364 (-) Transcript_12806:345-1436(-)